MTTLGALGAGLALDMPAPVLPLGSLAIGGLVAVLFALVLVGRGPRVSLPTTLRGLVREGRWLMMAAVTGPVAGWGVGLLVGHLAGSDALGVAEAARVVAQPVLVFAVGLAAVLRPSAMESATRSDGLSASRRRRRFAGAVALVGTLYVAAAVVPSAVNPLRALIPVAFTIPGLVQLSIVAAAINGVVFLHRAELIARVRSRVVGAAEAWSALVRLVVGTAAAVVGPWTVPLGFLAQGGFRWGLLGAQLGKEYRSNPLEVP